jgi:hypothetical protein
LSKDNYCELDIYQPIMEHERNGAGEWGRLETKCKNEYEKGSFCKKNEWLQELPFLCEIKEL